MGSNEDLVITSLTGKHSDLPVIDFAQWSLDCTSEERYVIGKSLADACHYVGFVYIVNHGVAAELIDEAFEWSRKLFGLRSERKMLAPHPPGPEVHRGYSYPGLEKVSQVMVSSDPGMGDKLREVKDCKESYEIGSEENEEQPNIWLPEDVLPGYKKFISDFYWQCSKTSKEILQAIGTGLEIKDPDFFNKFHSGHNNQLRLLHYPPIPAVELETQASSRMPAHTDWGSITMLFQDDCGGLEVEDPYTSGKFVKAIPLKHALVMNIGDLLMRWSNDYLKSTLHRVTLPPLQDRFTGMERLTRARYSIPYFVAPDSDALIECIPECTDATKPAKYMPVRWREYRLIRGKLHY